MIRQVLAYAKFLKDLCTIKRIMYLKKKKLYWMNKLVQSFNVRPQSSIRIRDVQLSLWISATLLCKEHF